MTSGNEPTIFRLVAQYLDATLVRAPHHICDVKEKSVTFIHTVNQPNQGSVYRNICRSVVTMFSWNLKLILPRFIEHFSP
jgi:hypothetical protein